MERMSKTIEISVYDLQELRNENIRLKSDIDAMIQNEKGYKYDINKLEKENIKLNEFKEKREESMFYFKAQMERAEPKTAREAEDLQKAKEIFEGLYRKELSCLEEENRNLKEEVKKWKMVADENGTHYDMLEEENEKLKSDLEECQCSFGFENDEVGYRKREYKRLKKWIKDHCKGYGNLFLEDEMKRQWKKADKKRKKSDLYKDVGLMEEDTLQELKDIGEI